MQLAMVTVRRVLLRPWTDATLSGIAAQSPVPVHLTVDVPERLAPTVEAVGYLRISITDDGIGGAEESRGTGLTGLAQRAASVDGVFRITSPQGGPTMIRVELPCES